MPKEKKPGKHRAKVVHPNSRKAAQMVREAHRKEKMERRQAEKQVTISNKIAKLMWFRTHMDEDKQMYSPSDMVNLIESYLHRLDDELDRLIEQQTENRHTGRHYRLRHAPREDAIRSIIVNERQLFEGQGLEAPDLTSAKAFKIFVEWNGEEKLLPKIALKNYRAETCSTET